MDKSKIILRGILVTLIGTILIPFLPMIGLDIDVLTAADWASDGQLTLGEIIGFIGLVVSAVAAYIMQRDPAATAKKK